MRLEKFLEKKALMIIDLDDAWQAGESLTNSGEAVDRSYLRMSKVWSAITGL
jgi:hypothetical protein